MVAMVGAYCSPVFSVLANSKRNNNYGKIRMTHKNIDGGYTTYIEVYIAEASQNNYDVFLHNQSMRSENDIRFQTVPFLPAEEGTEVIGTEQDL